MIPSAAAGPDTVRNPKDPNGFTNGLMARMVWWHPTPADSRVRRL